jgi:hypothetical protein
MIAELVTSSKVVFGLQGDFSHIVERLAKQSSVPDLAARFLAQKTGKNNEQTAISVMVLRCLTFALMLSLHRSCFSVCPQKESCFTITKSK